MTESTLEPDDIYRCNCDARFVDQIEYERHLFDEHDRLRDTLESINPPTLP